MSDFFAYIVNTPGPLPGTEWMRQPGLLVNRKMRWQAAIWNNDGFSERWIKASSRPIIEENKKDEINVQDQDMSFRFFDNEPKLGDHLMALTLYLGRGEPLERWLLWAEFKEIKAGELDYTGEDKEWTVEAAVKILRYVSFAKL